MYSFFGYVGDVCIGKLVLCLGLYLRIREVKEAKGRKFNGRGEERSAGVEREDTRGKE